MAKKDEKKFRWNWKTFWIILLVILLVIVSYSYRNYQREVEDALHELELNLTKKYANLDCYERGYFTNKFCYDKPCITQTCESGYRLACIQN